jgi:hypothetical protein
MYTVTECPKEVTKCPAHYTSVVYETYAVSTTVCPVGEKEKEKDKSYPTGYPVDHETYKPSKAPQSYEASKPTAPACPTYSVKTISTSVTTVVPTVIYETVQVPCPTGKPSPSGYPPKGNGT